MDSTPYIGPRSDLGEIAYRRADDPALQQKQVEKIAEGPSGLFTETNETLTGQDCGLLRPPQQTGDFGGADKLPDFRGVHN